MERCFPSLGIGMEIKHFNIAIFNMIKVLKCKACCEKAGNKIKCADIKLYRVVKISADCEEEPSRTEQQSKIKLHVNSCKNLPNLAYKMVGPELITTPKE